MWTPGAQLFSQLKITLLSSPHSSPTPPILTCFHPCYREYDSSNFRPPFFIINSASKNTVSPALTQKCPGEEQNCSQSVWVIHLVWLQSLCPQWFNSMTGPARGQGGGDSWSISWPTGRGLWLGVLPEWQKQGRNSFPKKILKE